MATEAHRRRGEGEGEPGFHAPTVAVTSANPSRAGGALQLRQVKLEFAGRGFKSPAAAEARTSAHPRGGRAGGSSRAAAGADARRSSARQSATRAARSGAAPAARVF